MSLHFTDKSTLVLVIPWFHQCRQGLSPCGVTKVVAFIVTKTYTLSNYSWNFQVPQPEYAERTTSIRWLWNPWFLAPIPLTEFRSNSEFDQNVECSGLKYAQRYHNEILYTSPRFYCGDLSKILLWSAEHVMNKSTMKFHWISKSTEISLVVINNHGLNYTGWTRNDSNFLCHLGVEKWNEIQMYVFVSPKINAVRLWLI